MQRINKIEGNWTRFGESDPYWAVLTNPNYKNNKWNKEEFYKSGESQFNRIVDDFGPYLNKPFDTIVDFGCGPGRITFQLAKIASRVIGVDISLPMIEMANKINEENICEFVVNKETNLKFIKSGTIDLVFSFITLQHNPPEIIFKYLDEFIRIASKSSGQILFNLVSKPPLFYRLLHYLFGQRVLNKLRKIKDGTNAAMEMNWVAEKEVINYFRTRNFNCVKIVSENSAGQNWNSSFYLFERAKPDINN